MIAHLLKMSESEIGFADECSQEFMKEFYDDAECPECSRFYLWHLYREKLVSGMFALLKNFLR